MSVEENKALVRRCYDEVWNKGDVSVLKEIYASDCVSNFTPSIKATFRGPEEYKQAVNIFRSAFPDLHFTIEDLIAEGDKVVYHWTARGTNDGEYMGNAPTGKSVTQTGITIFRCAGGKIVEELAIWDELNGLQQMGIAPTTQSS